MKLDLVLSVLAASVFSSSLAYAQCPSSSSNEPGSNPGGVRTETEQNIHEIVLKYYWKSAETQPESLKKALEDVPGVQSVKLPAGSKSAVVRFGAPCERNEALEAAALKAGVAALIVNHARVVVTLKAGRGADVKSAAEELATVEGVQAVESAASGLELHADLRRLSVAKLREAAGKFKCDVVVNQTHEYVTYKVVSGDAGAFRVGADAVKGVLVVRTEGAGLTGMWISKSHVRPEHLERMDGFKVERQ